VRTPLLPTYQRASHGGQLTLLCWGEISMEIERLLEEGTTVVCDRYAFSGLAFSLAKVRPGSLSWNPSNKKNADSLL
jgi:hypothetical protein